MKERVREDVKTGLALGRVDSLLLPWVSDRWGALRPPVSQEALRMSCALATATYDMNVKPWLEAGWQDVTIQVDGDLTTGVDLPDEDAGTMERLAASWRMHRVRSRIKQRNPLGQVLDAFRQIRESDTGKALVMAHPSPDGRIVVAISFMGTGERFYDWFSNFRLSPEEGMHKGFLQLARQFEENEGDIAFPETAKMLGLDKLTLRQVIEEAKSQKSRFMLWLSGHSQGGSVMQIYCRMKLHEDGVLPENMIGYGFASPSVMADGTDAKPDAYPLYHVINRDDLFARLGAMVHLSVLLQYEPDERMTEVCYRWPQSDAAKLARQAARGILDTIQDTPSSIVFGVAYLSVLASLSPEDMITGLSVMQMRSQSLRRFISAADSHLDSVLRRVARRAVTTYAEITGHAMNPQTLTSLQAKIVAAVDTLGMKAFSQALLELMKYPHSIAGKFEGGLPSYQYIAMYGLDRLEPVLPQHRVRHAETELPGLAAEAPSGLVNRRRVPLERVARRVRTYSQLHPRNDVRMTRSAALSAVIRDETQLKR